MHQAKSRYRLAASPETQKREAAAIITLFISHVSKVPGVPLIYRERFQELSKKFPLTSCRCSLDFLFPRAFTKDIYRTRMKRRGIAQRDGTGAGAEGVREKNSRRRIRRQ